ncbi:MAG: DUF4166 domain-containing protein [Rhizobiales bacterium]|nr:DUF4166 domain-containing protein [Hyphomicrobiales bacterium]
MSEQAPIFRGIFGADWDRLLPVFRQHYANRPFSHDVVVVEGVMDVELSWLARLFAPLMRFSGALVPVAGRDIPVTVTFRSDPDSPSFAFDREFRFPGRKPYHFRSVMLPAGGNEVIEWMAIGFGWRAAFSYGEGQVRLEHRGYALRWFGKAIPIPLEWLLGRGHAWERAIDDTQFAMAMTIRHRFFGQLYGYSGTFCIEETRLDR